MFFIELFAHPAGRLVTLILLHFVWQGFAVQFLLIAVQQLGGIQRATVRYSLSLAALLLMAICPLTTMTWLWLNNGTGESADILGASAAVQAEAVASEAWGRGHSLNANLLRWVVFAQPYVLATWAMGVSLVGGRLLIGVVGLSRLRRGCLPLPPELQRIVERVRRTMQMHSLPAVYLSSQVSEAMAVGLVRPLVLIPASWAMEMPLEMLEAIVAHELAHLRRRDLWVNLLQRIVEAFLFYHPAVWWLSQRLRIERELCTDEMAVAVTGQRLAYVQALEQVAHRRRADVRPALAAFLRGETNMRLLERVRNVLGLSAREQSRLWPAGLVALLLPLGLWMLSIGQPTAIADDDRDDDKEVIERKIKRQEAEDRDDEREKPEPKRPAIRDEDILKYYQEKIRQLNADKDQAPKKPMKVKPSPRIESELVETKPPAKPGSKEQRVVEELAAAVKKLSAQVEKLQEEVAELRGEQPKKPGKKEASFYDYFELKPGADKNTAAKQLLEAFKSADKIDKEDEQELTPAQKKELLNYERAVKEKFAAEAERLKAALAEKEAMQNKFGIELKRTDELLRAQAAKARLEADKAEQALKEYAESYRRKAEEAAARADKKAATEKESDLLEAEQRKAEKERAVKLLQEKLKREAEKEKDKEVEKDKEAEKKEKPPEKEVKKLEKQ